MNQTKKGIHIRSVGYKEDIELFSDIGAMSLAINKSINLGDYGNNVETLVFVPVLVPFDNTIHENYFDYNKRTKRVEISKKLDYTEAKSYNLSEFNEAIAQLFLTSIEELKTKNIKDFDTIAFKRDAERVLIEQGWLKSKEVIEVC